jgi:ABC-type multidrug transport system ATPase subunit
MTLLELVGVSKRYWQGSRERSALRDVSLEMDRGELLAIWGMRRSGRSTLLRVAAGLEAPDTGIVRFDGHDLAARRGELLSAGIRYCRRTFRHAEGQVVLDQLIVSQLARGISARVAKTRASSALTRAGVERSAGVRPGELDAAEAVHVAIARALTFKPRLLVIDEPAIGLDPRARDEVLLLLRSLSDEGIAVLMSAGEMTGLTGADRALSLDDGALHGNVLPELASVTPLRRRA